MKNEMKSTEIETKTVAERIPELSAKQKSLAALRENADWANWFWTAPVGYLHDDRGRGVTWLVAGEGRVRCIRVWDSAYCYEALAIMAASMRLVDLEVEVDPFAVVGPTTRGHQRGHLPMLAGRRWSNGIESGETCPNLS